MTPEGRLDRIERALAELAAAGGNLRAKWVADGLGHAQTGGRDRLAQQAPNLCEIAAEVYRASWERDGDPSPVQWLGDNLDDVRAWTAGHATANVDPATGTLYAIQNGFPTAVPRGHWLSRDHRGRIVVFSQPPAEVGA